MTRGWFAVVAVNHSIVVCCGVACLFLRVCSSVWAGASVYASACVCLCSHACRYVCVRVLAWVHVQAVSNCANLRAQTAYAHWARVCVQVSVNFSTNTVLGASSIRMLSGHCIHLVRFLEWSTGTKFDFKEIYMHLKMCRLWCLQYFIISIVQWWPPQLMRVCVSGYIVYVMYYAKLDWIGCLLSHPSHSFKPVVYG